ncbi:Homoserine kinase [Kordia antarctica]|uniref:Homoserine kinase n=1 Tax=Kordia antarctica TaxID=1218801 RepID=A0A7L4ZG95_9FLAO|nr:kinase [Kordia antarctica]QHI35441.1 Homoserine kinase [Kordia antarctica]
MEIEKIKALYQEKLQATNKNWKVPGVGSSFCHHGEILQGEFYCDELKQSVYGLCTLKCNIFSSKAQFYKTDDKEIKVFPEYKIKAKKGVENLLKYLNINIGGRLVIDSDIRPKLGFGSSTTDVVSSIMAVLDVLELELNEMTIAKLAVYSETASDSIMFKDEVLFAQRKGLIIEKFPQSIPQIHVLGFSDPSNDGYCTVSMEPLKYNSKEKLQFNELRDILRNSIKTQDVNLLGKVTTQSTLINQNYYQKKNLDKILKIMEDNQSAGIQISHSGNLMGLIWDNSIPFIEDKIENTKEQLRALNIKSFWTFTK